MGGAGNIEWLIMRRSALTRDVMLKVGAVDETLVSGFTRSWYEFPTIFLMSIFFTVGSRNVHENFQEMPYSRIFFRKTTLVFTTCLSRSWNGRVASYVYMPATPSSWCSTGSVKAGLTHGSGFSCMTEM